MDARRILLCLVWCIVSGGLGLNLDQCRTPLGMQTGEIPDSAITASSSYGSDVGPADARIRTETNGGAWCPKAMISSNVYEYLQIDLGELKVISLVETMGRFGNGQGQEFADQYLLEFQREEGADWIRFHNRDADEIFQGNTNTYTAEPREVDPPIIARKVRFIPYSTRPKMVCMRVELHGCTWTDGTVSYSMPQGERRGSGIDLIDFTYDGQRQESERPLPLLSGGLGQLTDGEEGRFNFRLESKSTKIRGYDWIGWRNETFMDRPVELVFRFDAVRNFSSMQIHANNLYSKEVRVFKTAKVYFSIGGDYYLDPPVEFQYMRDPVLEMARTVIIALKERVGRFVKVQLFFDAKWMLISEVQFQSVYATGNFTPESPPTVAPPAVSPSSTPPNGIIEVNFPAGLDEALNKSRSGNWQAGDGGFHAGNYTPTTPLLNTSRAHQSLDDQYIGIIIGALAALILLLFVVIVIIIWRHRKHKYNNNHRSMKSIEPRHVTLDLSDLRTNSFNGKLSNGNMYNCVAISDGDSDREGACCPKLEARDFYQDPVDSLHGIQIRKLPELPSNPDYSTDTNTSREYAVPDSIDKSSLIVNCVPQYNNTLGSSRPPTLQKALPAYQGQAPGMASPYAASDVLSLPNIQGVSGNNVYGVPNNLDLLWMDDFQVMEFPRENLQFMEKLGEGQFGEVHLCEAVKMTDFLGDDFLVNRTGSHNMMVAVKMLRPNTSQQARQDFDREVKVMSRMKDPNIVRVLGVCTVDEPLCVIVEYMKYGDLNQFLQQHVLEGTSTKKKRMKVISSGGLIYMASQVASGMKYLESLNMVHRDLAARNCLVGNFFTIKISDFGMSRGLYSSDYYRIEGKAVLPIRWMAWESILLGKFSTKSDVWSFGVTLWEILTLAREQPFGNVNDEQVIENCGHFFKNDQKETYLPCPAHCPRELYDLMRECWNREASHRPSFREIHMFLQRKNMGYDPQDELDMTGTQHTNVPVV